MAQQYHSLITLDGTEDQMRAFLTAALQISSWDWHEIRFKDEPNSLGAVTMDFYSRGFPRGLGELMAAHPEVTLTCDCHDLSAEVSTHIVMKAGRMSEETITPWSDDDEQPQTTRGDLACDPASSRGARTGPADRAGSSQAQATVHDPEAPG